MGWHTVSSCTPLLNHGEGPVEIIGRHRTTFSQIQLSLKPAVRGFFFFGCQSVTMILKMVTVDPEPSSGVHRNQFVYFGRFQAGFGGTVSYESQYFGIRLCDPLVRDFMIIETDEWIRYFPQGSFGDRLRSRWEYWYMFSGRSLEDGKLVSFKPSVEDIFR